MSTFAVTADNAYRENQTVKHIYTERRAYPNISRGTENRLERLFDIEDTSGIEVFEPACGMDVERIPREFEMVSEKRVRELYEAGELCGKCLDIAVDTGED